MVLVRKSDDRADKMSLTDGGLPDEAQSDDELDADIALRWRWWGDGAR